MEALGLTERNHVTAKFLGSLTRKIKECILGKNMTASQFEVLIPSKNVNIKGEINKLRPSEHH